MIASHARPGPDLLIVGAGPAGLSMACALADAGIRSTVLEQAPLAAIANPVEDGREIALTHRGVQVLQGLGAWQDLAPSEIHPLVHARVFNGEAQRSLYFDSRQAGADRLGHLVANQALRRIAYQGALRRSDMVELQCDAKVKQLCCDAEQASVTLEDGRSFSAALLIAADSRFSASRRMAGIGAEMRDFGRSVIVCRVAHQRPHGHTALECFHHGHTMAWLPLQDGVSSLVLTLPADQVDRMLALNESGFMAWVQTHSQDRLGKLRLIGPRHHYPLVATYAHRFCVHRFALIGDAAVGMHPVTAHGYNFGLYGIESLSRLLAEAKAQGRDLGSAEPLQAFAQQHRRATWPIYQGTNLVVRLFTDDRAGARWLRQGVLEAANRLPPLKAAITAQLTGRGLTQHPLLRQAGAALFNRLQSPLTEPSRRGSAAPNQPPP
ncbi:MAG: 5-demethoxyubiquinol-8 5-hydroxylase UbiM [Burkholderiaceae bacterium]|nr:5-demethoxyubiquinol-8 5-hydroxylase UbiM [Roseateles sp.]MBV8469923.1 5-demethoxyubiquinol-8 5-hydroxylase UbiM [Burkholderiaceae bacterium]